MKFRSSVSWWYIAILMLFFTMLGLAAVQFTNGFDWFTFIVVIAYVLFIGISLIPQILNTTYTITDRDIVITNGFKAKTSIPIKKIEAVEAFKPKTPSIAMGGQRITIVYRDGKTKLQLGISPLNIKLFIETLKTKMIERTQHDRKN